MTDMDKALALVPVASATKTASGGPASSLGLVDGDMLYVPSGVSLLWDLSVCPLLKWIRVDGSLTVDPNATLVMNTGLIVGVMGGSISLDNSTGTGSFVCTWPSGPMDNVNDPYLIGRGIIPMGGFTLRGQTMLAYVESQGALHGATSITLNSAPTGWRVGDKIVVPGVGAAVLDDDVVTITGISGNVVTFTPALVKDHTTDQTPCSYDSTQWRRPIRVGNISPCSIDFVSSDTTIANRGHLMAMNGNMSMCYYASFRNMGRTNKAVVLTDPNGTVGSTQANPRGRYAWHSHVNGVSPTGPQAMVYGCRVVGSPGWGFVNHGSNVCFDSNFAYNVYGCSFVCERGDENGCFCDNTAIRNAAPIGTKVLSQAGTDRSVSGIPQSDWLRDGHGFGTMAGPVVFQGRNVVYGAPFVGLLILGTPFKVPTVGGTVTTITRTNLPDPSITTLDNFPPGYVPQNVQRVDVYGSNAGHEHWSLNLNGSPAPIAPSTFSKVHCEVSGESAVMFGYETDVNYDQFEMFPIKQDWSQASGSSYGFEHSGVNGNTHLTNGIIGRFAIGVMSPTLLTNTIDSVHHDCLTGVRVMNANNQWRSLAITNFTNSALTPTQLSAITVGHYDHHYFKLQSGIPDAGPFNVPRYQKDVLLYGDMGGATMYNSPTFWTPLTAVPCVQVMVENDVITLAGQYCFFNENGPNFPLSTLGTTTPSQYQSLTVGQLYAQYGLTLGGKILPTDAAVQSNVFGLTSINPATML